MLAPTHKARGAFFGDEAGRALRPCCGTLRSRTAACPVSCSRPRHPRPGLDVSWSRQAIAGLDRLQQVDEEQLSLIRFGRLDNRQRTAARIRDCARSLGKSFIKKTSVKRRPIIARGIFTMPGCRMPRAICRLRGNILPIISVL